MCKKQNWLLVLFSNKKLFSRLLLFIVFYPFFGFSAVPEKWKELHSYKGNLTLSLKSNPDVYASITRSSGIDLKALASNSSAFKNLEKKQQQMLSLVNIRDWRVSSHQWKTMKDKKELSMEGSFLNYKDNKYHFKELHIYSATSVLQVLAAAPSLKELKLAQPEELFQKVREGAIQFSGE